MDESAADPDKPIQDNVSGKPEQGGMTAPVGEWFFTHAEGQSGPVTFEVLQAKAAAGELHPRSDLVWKDGMAEWKPAGEIEGLFERRAVVEEEVVVAPTALTEQEKAAKKDAFEEVEVWPGARRRWYLFLIWVFPVLWTIGFVALLTVLGPKLSPGFQKLLILLGAIVPVFVVIDVSLSRLSNVGMNKLWFLGHFIPLLNLWVGYRSFACPAGYAQHKKLGAAGWILAIIYWGGVLMVAASMVLAPAMIGNLAKNPQVQQKIAELQEALKKKEPEKKGGKKQEEDGKKQGGAAPSTGR